MQGYAHMWVLHRPGASGGSRVGLQSRHHRWQGDRVTASILHGLSFDKLSLRCLTDRQVVESGGRWGSQVWNLGGLGFEVWNLGAVSCKVVLEG